MFNKDSILKILEKKGWSKYKLCKEAHLAQSTLSDILSGKAKNPNTKTLQKIADALGVSINEFFDEDTEETNADCNKEPIEKIMPTIPTEFTNPDEARAYISKHQIFGSNGFNLNKMSDDEVLEFANELLKQMELVAYKYKNKN